MTEGTPLESRQVKKILPDESEYLEVAVNRPGEEPEIHTEVTEVWNDIDRVVLYFDDQREELPVNLSEKKTVTVRDGGEP